MTSLRALIFDMDGLMIDSERLYFTAEHEMARSYGREVSEETLRQMMGRKPLESLEIYVRETGLPISAEKAYEIRNGLMRDKLRNEVAAMPGLGRILQRFRGRLKLAVATGAQSEFLRIVVARLRLDGVFDILQDSDDIATGKPDPEIFLSTCARLGLPPAACAVLEDSGNGVLAGRQAGCYVIAVPNEYTRRHDFSPADYIAACLDDAAEHIESCLADGAEPAASSGR
ncbi:MAG: HAD family phosphatase [Candidatus Aminicenantes bacterium]|nr:HAD family phosphatase [Candidatus Aminicenantes bacterium]